MVINAILANPDIIRLESFISEPDAITIVVHSKQKQPCYPKCSQPSVSLHSHYRRKVSDLLWHITTIAYLNKSFWLVLYYRTRKFEENLLILLFNASVNS